MPQFKVILSGRGIDYTIGDDRAVGFFTTRLVKAPDLETAQSKARELVLSEWRAGGDYASGNRGGSPALAIEEAFQVGFFAALFGRRPRGYSFYRHED